MKLLLDENIPLCIKNEIKTRSIRVRHVGEIGKGITDKEVFDIAIKNKECIITNDRHFDKYQKRKHYGIIRLSSGLKQFGEKELKKVLETFKNKFSLENVYIKINSDSCKFKYNKYTKTKMKTPIRF